MNLRVVGVMLLMVGSLLVHGRALGAEVVRPLLVVRTYQATPIRGDDWNVTVRETTGILDAAGIDVQWVRCGVEPAHDIATPSRCSMPFQSNEVAVRIVRLRTGVYRGELPLGESLLDGTLRSGVLATIYLDRVEWLACAGSVRVNILLARAIAHELGHLLLGTSAHSARGLMRPLWTRDELIRGQAVDWTIPPADSARMRVAYYRRTERVAAQGTE
jgi:hypothetical protein